MKQASTSYIERQNGTMRHKIGRMRRLVLAFSKRPEQHRAAVALNYVHYNLCHIPRTTRITPAMGVGIVKGPWSLEELLDALLAVQPCDPPGSLPLSFHAPVETSRELPNGRGFLRALPGGKGGAPAPTPTPEVPTPSLAAPVAPVEVLGADPRQLTIWDYKPRRPAKPPPPPGTQLNLFEESLEWKD